jgi:hypothetical protein
VIVYSADRLSRSAAHLSILSDECDRAGCRLIFVREGHDDVGISQRSDEAYAAGVERDLIRERMARGRRFKIAQGRPAFGGWPLYGYRPDREAGVYRVFEPEATVIRRIFSMCSSGRGMHSIASTFNREGLPSPKSDRRPGARWTSASVCSILNNRSYMGEEYCCKTRRGPTGRDLPRPDSDRVRLQFTPMINWMKRRIERSRARCHRAARALRRSEECRFHGGVMLNVELRESQIHRRGAEDAEGAPQG